MTNRFSDFVFGPASVLRFKVESPAFATLFQILRKSFFRIHYNEQPAINKKWVKNIKITKQHSKRWYSLRLFHFVSVIFATHKDPTVASLNLQEHSHTIEKWLKKWKINANESKSSHIKFALLKGHCLAVNINQTIIPQTEAVNTYDYTSSPG